MTRYFYDCEFIEDGFTIELISIGMVADDGRELYLVNADVSDDAILHNTWLRENVWPSLPTRPLTEAELEAPRAFPLSTLRRLNRKLAVEFGTLDRSDPVVVPKAIIADRVREFLLTPGKEVSELWAYYGAYDHVALAQLFGRMIDLPEGVPMFTHDIMQAAGGLTKMLPDQESGQHNALADARHVQLMWRALAVLRFMGVTAGIPDQGAVRGPVRPAARPLHRVSRLRRPLARDEKLRAEVEETRRRRSQAPAGVVDYPSDEAIDHYNRGGIIRVPGRFGFPDRIAVDGRWR